ncbi:hypothetical protein [Pseudomonas viridiflava]|uniref:hypothetical protein n=1 Tax=Pseudomonas viridiflava TaxID=33069 RepID=UPI000290FA09|nr:hypothetical protein AAI_09636 [Pseudomonas viridiflava UASWS0038]
MQWTSIRCSMPDNPKQADALRRQRIYRERQRAQGFKQNTLWIHIECEMEGRMAAREGKPFLPFLSRDPLSWSIGWMNETLRSR